MVSAQAPTRFSSVHRPRSVSVAVLAVAVVVLAAVLTTAVVRHNAVAKLDLPAASPLTNTIVVASGLTTPLESGEASSSASGHTPGRPDSRGARPLWQLASRLRHGSHRG